MRLVAMSLLTAVVLVWSSTGNTVQAQENAPMITVGGGLGIPLDAEGVNSGPAIRAGVSVPVTQNLHATLEGHFSNNSGEDNPSEPGLAKDTNQIGGNLGLMLRTSSSTVNFYGQGGIGMTRSKKEYDLTPAADIPSHLLEGIPTSGEMTENVLSFTVGGGVLIPINPSVGVALDARYVHAMTENEATKWMPVTVSIVFSL